MPNHVMNICVKFQRNRSTKYRDIVALDIRAGLPGGSLHYIMPPMPLLLVEAQLD